MIRKALDKFYIDCLRGKELGKIVGVDGNDLDGKPKRSGGVGYVGGMDMKTARIPAPADKQEASSFHFGISLNPPLWR
ncbi:hypothetical protein X756_03335 [Mesorhizobium sp. LSHC412B00]|nr:hypothetical protein X756_03335 [Mesorhizobium sp. LSHC412B00]